MLKGPVFVPILIVTASFFFHLDSLQAQANPTADRKSELSAYGAFTHAWPDYGTPGNGGIFGFEYTRFLSRYVTPSLELRGKIISAAAVKEDTWGGGIKGSHRFRNFYPYVDFLVSSGTIKFNFPFIDNRGKYYESDNSIVYSAGLGVDYDVARHWAARFDYQFEHWNLGTNQSLTPEAMSIGVVYHLPAHNR